MKIFLMITIFFSLVFASIQSDIAKKTKALSNIETNYQQMDKRLADVAKKIVNARAKRVSIIDNIDRLEKDLGKKRELYAKTQELYVKSKNELEQLALQKEQTEKELKDMIVKEFGLMVALENSEITTAQSFIDNYIFEITSEYTNQKIKELNDRVIAIVQKQEDLSKKNAQYQKIIASMQKKQKELTQNKQELDQLIAKLNDDQNSYRARLVQIEREKNALAQTLKDLKIVAQEQERVRQERLRKERELAAATTSTTTAPIAPLQRNDVDYQVRQIGSSYHQDNLYAYRGPKTISPIENATIVRDFGTYTDPIYNIKIFNESIVLRAPSSPANVRTVLNGEVLYAQDTNMLGKVIIIKHDGDMHTIYAGLSRIAPGVKVGQKIAKGFVIGRVDGDLTFEATKNSRHLNPTRLISLR